MIQVIQVILECAVLESGLNFLNSYNIFFSGMSCHHERRGRAIPIFWQKLVAYDLEKLF